MFDSAREINGFDKDGIHVGTAIMTPDGRWTCDGKWFESRTAVEGYMVSKGARRFTTSDGIKR